MTMPLDRRSHSGQPVRRWGVSLLALALVVVACAYYANRLTAWLAYDDEGGYLYAAWRISLGQAPYRDFLTPQLPLFLYPGAIVLRLSGESVYAARFSMILYTVGAALFIFWSARRLWGELVALLTLVLVLTHQEMFWAARFFRPEGPMLFWGMLGLMLLVHSHPRRSRLGLAAAGMMLALATMSKLFGALMMAGAGLFVLAEGIRTRDWRDTVRTALWLGLPYVVIVLGMALCFSLVSPDFVAAVLGHHLRQGSGTPAPQVISKALSLYWSYVKTQPVLWSLAALGLYASARGAPERRVFVWQLPTLLAFLAMTRELQARHFTYTVPSLALCAAVGLGWLTVRGRKLWAGGVGRWAMTVAGAALVTAVVAPQMGHNAWVSSWSESTTGEWSSYIAGRTTPGDVVISDYPGLNFYAKRPTTRLAAGISRGAAKSGQIRGVDLIAEIEQSQARMVLLNVAQGAHQFANLTDYEVFKRYVQENFALVERKQYDYRLLEVYLRDDLWPGDKREVLLGHELALTGVAWEQADIAPGEQALVLLRWQARADMAEDYAVTLRLLDSVGVEWGLGGKALVDIDRETYWDEAGLEQPVLVQTSDWPLFETTIGHYELPVAVGTPPGVYRAVARVHPKGSWVGLAVHDPANPSAGYDLPLGTVTVRFDPGARQIQVPLAMRAPLAEGIALLGTDTATRQVRPGDNLALSLYWALDNPPADLGEMVLSLRADKPMRLYRGPLLGIDSQVALVTGPAELRGQYLLRLPADLASGSYPLAVQIADSEPFDVGTVEVQGQPRSFASPPMQHTSGAYVEGVARLLGYELADDAVNPGGEARLLLHWQCDQTPAIAYTVFVHLLDAEGRVVAQHDGPPANGESPTTSWVPGQVITDSHTLTIPADTAAGEYRIAVGLYDPATGLRAPLYDAADKRLPDDRLILDTGQVIEP